MGRAGAVVLEQRLHPPAAIQGHPHQPHPVVGIAAVVPRDGLPGQALWMGRAQGDRRPLLLRVHRGRAEDPLLAAVREQHPLRQRLHVHGAQRPLARKDRLSRTRGEAQAVAADAAPVPARAGALHATVDVAAVADARRTPQRRQLPAGDMGLQYVGGALAHRDQDEGLAVGGEPRIGVVSRRHVDEASGGEAAEGAAGERIGVVAGLMPGVPDIHGAVLGPAGRCTCPAGPMLVEGLPEVHHAPPRLHPH